MIPALNQFTGSGLLLLGAGGAMAYLRNIPVKLWQFILLQTTVTMTVKDEDSSFVWMKEWMLEQAFIKKVRRVDLDSKVKRDTISLLPAPGDHFFWLKKRPFFVNFKRSEEAKGGYDNAKRSESFTIRTIGRKQAFLSGLVTEVIACRNRNSDKMSHLYTYGDYWGKVFGYRPRSIDAVILPEGEREKLLGDVDKFIKSRDRYSSLGVPYHRGYLFYGPPGTGKTSLTSALAAHFGVSVYVMNLNGMTDNKLKDAMNDTGRNSVILFEDIDCVGIKKRDVASVSKRAKKDGEEKGSMLGVTLSGLLNVLDGFYAPDGVIFVMTTNNIDTLDAALMRPGRIDYKLYMGPATVFQKVSLYRRFFPERSEQDAHAELAQRPENETMAEFQGHLLSQLT